MLTVETEKAVDDVEAPASGVLRKIVAAVGSEVPVMGASPSSPHPAKTSATTTSRRWSPRRAAVPRQPAGQRRVSRARADRRPGMPVAA